MGFTTVVHCDLCERELEDKEDYASIVCRFELDRNTIGVADERDSKSGVFCESCSKLLWKEIMLAFGIGEEDERHRRFTEVVEPGSQPGGGASA